MYQIKENVKNIEEFNLLLTGQLAPYKDKVEKLIDVLDDSTMLSDPMVILVSGLLGAIAEFALLMSIEIIITSLIINLSLTTALNGAHLI